MPDTCVKSVTVSRALYHMFEQHRRREYMIIWYLQYVKSYKNREDVVKRIVEVFGKILNDNIEAFPHDENFIKGQHKRARRTQQFIDDFKMLSHADIDTLRDMTSPEAYGQAYGDTTKIVTINKKPFKVED